MTWLVSLYSITSILYFYDKQSFYTQGLDCLPWILCRYPSCRCMAGMDNGSCGCFRAHCSCHSVLFYNIASASIVSETKKEMKANQSAVISYSELKPRRVCLCHVLCMGPVFLQFPSVALKRQSCQIVMLCALENHLAFHPATLRYGFQ